MKKPVQLAGMKRGGCSKDGSAVFFELESQGGKVFPFSFPQEAISEVVENLTLLSEIAWKQRGSPDLAKEPPGTKAVARARTATSIAVSVSRAGPVLTFQCGPMKHEVLLPPELNIQLSEGMAQAHKEWLRLYPPN